MIASKIKSFLLLGIVLGFAAICNFSYLDFGTPSWKKHLQIFGTRAELEKWIPVMVEQRNQYYAAYSNMLDPKKTDSESREIYKKTFLSHEKDTSWQAHHFP